MKLLIIGATGMAGHLITTYFKEKKYDVTTLCNTHPFDENSTLINVCQLDALEAYLKNNSFDIVINCAGMLIQAAEQYKSIAILVNSHLPHYLANFFAHSSTRIIHLSTDCIFSGANGPYTETSVCDGTLFYDRTKALGELNNAKDLTFRMSIIGPDLSPNGVGLLNWFLQQTGTIYGYSNVYWNGITTLELAKAIEQSITQNLTGLYHLVPQDNISKYNLLLLFKQTFNKQSIQILPKQVTPINKTLINTRTDFNYQVSSYPAMLQELLLWIKNHHTLYSHYNL